MRILFAIAIINNRFLIIFYSFVVTAILKIKLNKAHKINIFTK